MLTVHLLEKIHPVFSCSEQQERWSSLRKVTKQAQNDCHPPQKGCLKTIGFPEWKMQPEAWTSPRNLLPKMKMLLKFRKKKSQKISKIYLIVQIQDQTICYQDFTSWPGLEYSVYREETIGNPATPPSFWTSLPGILVLIIAFIYLNWEETAVSFWLGSWPACTRYLTNKN